MIPSGPAALWVQAAAAYPEPPAAVPLRIRAAENRRAVLRLPRLRVIPAAVHLPTPEAVLLALLPAVRPLTHAHPHPLPLQVLPVLRAVSAEAGAADPPIAAAAAAEVHPTVEAEVRTAAVEAAAAEPTDNSIFPSSERV